MTFSENPFVHTGANEPPPPPPPTSEREYRERLRQELLCDLMLHRAERVTAGNNGIILRLPFDTLTAEEKKKMRDLGLDWENESAIKILKVLDPTQSQREYGIQNEAYRLITAQENQEEYAQVPTPLYHGHVSLKGGKREALSEKAEFNFPHEGCQIIAMDFIQGDDLATIVNREILQYLYQHLMKRKEMAPLIKNYDRCWEAKDYNELQRNLEDLFRTLEGFDYRMTGLSSDLIMRYPSEGATSAETLRRVYHSNAKAKLELLKASGFSFNPIIAKKIAKTLRLLKERGIHMTDSHQRNFMITGDVTGDGEAEAYVIDYGNAYLSGDLANQYGEKPVEDIGQGIEDTENILNWLIAIQKAAGRTAAAR